MFLFSSCEPEIEFIELTIGVYEGSVYSTENDDDEEDPEEIWALSLYSDEFDESALRDSEVKSILAEKPEEGSLISYVLKYSDLNPADYPNDSLQYHSTMNGNVIEGDLDYLIGTFIAVIGDYYKQFDSLADMNAYMESEGLTAFEEETASDDSEDGDLVGTTWIGHYDYYGVAVTDTLYFYDSSNCKGTTEADGDSITVNLTYTYDPSDKTGTLTGDSTMSFYIEGNELNFNNVIYYKQ